MVRDAELLAAAKREPEAFGKLYDRYSERAYGWGGGAGLAEVDALVIASVGPDRFFPAGLPERALTALTYCKTVSAVARTADGTIVARSTPDGPGSGHAHRDRPGPQQLTIRQKSGSRQEAAVAGTGAGIGPGRATGSGSPRRCRRALERPQHRRSRVGFPLP